MDDTINYINLTPSSTEEKFYGNYERLAMNEILKLTLF